MGDEERKGYRQLYDARLQERRRDVVVAAGVASEGNDAMDADANTFWGMGSKSCAIHPTFMTEAFRAGYKLPPASEVVDQSEFAVLAPDTLDLCGHGIQLEPCCLVGHGICQQQASFREATRLHDKLRELCDAIGRPAAKSGDTLFLFEGDPDGATDPGQGQRLWFFSLLSNISYNPKFQDWTHCRTADDSMIGAQVLQFPIEIDLEFAAMPGALDEEGPLGGISLRHEGSGELSTRLVALSRSWRVRLCRYRLVSPVRMRVEAVEGPEHPEACFGPKYGAPSMDRAREERLSKEVSAAISLSRSGDPFCAEPRRLAGGRGAPAGRGRSHGPSKRAAPKPSSSSRAPPTPTPLDDDLNVGGDGDDSAAGSTDDEQDLLPRGGRQRPSLAQRRLVDRSLVRERFDGRRGGSVGGGQPLQQQHWLGPHWL